MMIQLSKTTEVCVGIAIALATCLGTGACRNQENTNLLSKLDRCSRIRLSRGWSKYEYDEGDPVFALVLG
ncbi:MAG: hypothetical protein QGD94_10340, partial [Planctomycetia bacterium]|nr:hypothetical protein [Planctomycetia bacterium]